MHFLISVLIFALLSFAAFSEQGTMSTDDTAASQAEASMSGTTDEEMEAQEEEVQLIEKEEYDPMEDPIEVELDKDRMDEYEEEVEETTP